jgi:predicted lipid-binding transport protein (Tim44 family)
VGAHQHDGAVQAIADAASSAAASSTAMKTALGGGLVAIVGGLTGAELIALIGAVAALLGSVVQSYLAIQRRRDERQRHQLEMRVLASKLDHEEQKQ